MREKIDWKEYDTNNASLLIEFERHTFYSGLTRTRLFRTQQGDWFYTIGPDPESEGAQPFKKEFLEPHEAKDWLIRRDFTRQLRVHFETEAGEVKPVIKSSTLIASWNEKFYPMFPSGRLVEDLYIESTGEWVLKSRHGEDLIAISNDEIEKFITDLRCDDLSFQT